MPGARCARWPRVQWVVRNAHAFVRSHRKSPGIPRAMVLRLMSYSPRRSGFLVTVTPEKLASQELDAGVEASGPYDFAVRRKAPSSEAHPAATASRPTFVTIASAPRIGAG